MGLTSTRENAFVHGYSPLDPEDLLEAIESGEDISKLSGDFVVVNPKKGYAISSFLSALPYYYAVGLTGQLVFGANVFDVAKRAGLTWRWNERTIRSLGLYGHSINNDTLCDGVFRIPPASRVSTINGKVSIEALKVRQFSWDITDSTDNALVELKKAFDVCINDSDEVHLSLSSGYDSRLLLALCLSNSIAPKVSVMGNSDSTDVVIAKQICESVGIPLEVIKLDQNDYIKLGNKISKDTSGVKTACNWHTYIYGLGKDFSNGVHLVGSNGEFARSFFFDVRKLDFVSKRSPSLMMNLYWAARLAKRYYKFSAANPLIRKGVRAPIDLAFQAKLREHWGATQFLPALDAFYAEQRVRHFIGGGLACYSTHGSPRSPFLDANWIRAAAELARRHKQGNHFHSSSTAALYPRISQFNYNRLPDNTKGASYSPFSEVVKSSVLTELLIESKYLDRWTSRLDRIKILQDPNCNQEEERNFWMTLHFAGEVVSDSGIEVA